jgi:hypothetical protein
MDTIESIGVVRWGVVSFNKSWRRNRNQCKSAAQYSWTAEALLTLWSQYWYCWGIFDTAEPLLTLQNHCWHCRTIFDTAEPFLTLQNHCWQPTLTKQLALIIFVGIVKSIINIFTCFKWAEPRHGWPVSPATARYFYGSKLLRALKSKITVVLTYVSEK